MIKKLLFNDKVILCLILLNSVILFISCYISHAKFQIILDLIDNCITTIFMIEACVKIKDFGRKVYFKSGWNCLDFILIIISTPTLLAYIFNLEITDLSYLLIFRVLRVFKAFRFFKFIPNSTQLVNGIKRAIHASVFVSIGFIIYIFIVGMLSFYLYKESNTTYFTDPLQSLYTTFKLFTIEGWYEIPEAIVNNYSPFASFATYAYFIFIVLTGGVFGLSIVNSIFVDTMVSDNNDELEIKVDKIDSKITQIIQKLDEYETHKNS